MILFFKKKTGKVFATIDGRVHDQKAMACSIDDGTKDVGKYIIGWEETGETKEVIKEVRKFVEVRNNLFEKQIKKVKVKETVKKEHNLDKFKILQRFEDKTDFNPLKDVLIKNNKLVINNGKI